MYSPLHTTLRLCRLSKAWFKRGVIPLQIPLLKPEIYTTNGLPDARKHQEESLRPKNQGGGTRNVFPTGFLMHRRHSRAATANYTSDWPPKSPKEEMSLTVQQWAGSGAISPSLSSEPPSCVRRQVFDRSSLKAAQGRHKLGVQ